MSSALTGTSSQLQSQGLAGLQGQQPEFLSRLNSYNFGNNEGMTGSRANRSGFGSSGLRIPRSPQIYNFAPYLELSGGAREGLTPRTYDELELGNQFYNGFRPNPGSYGASTGRSGGYFLSPKDAQGQGQVYTQGPVNWGLNERSFSFTQRGDNTNNSQNLALAGESDINATDQSGGNAYNGGQYNFSDNYDNRFLKQSKFSEGLNSGGLGQYGITQASGQLDNKDRSNFSYTNRVNRSVSGGGSVSAKVGDISQGGDTSVNTKVKPTLDLGGQAATIFSTAVGTLAMANPLFRPLGAAIALAGMLSPKQEIRIEDNATATASGLLNTDRGLKLSSPGSITTSDRQGLFANSRTTSPIFGTNAIANIFGDSSNRQSISQQGTGSAELNSRTLQDLASRASVTSVDRATPNILGMNQRFLDESFPGRVSNNTNTSTSALINTTAGARNQVNINQNNQVISNSEALGLGRRKSNILSSNLTQNQDLDATLSSGASLLASSRLNTNANSYNVDKNNYLRGEFGANDLRSDTSNEILASLAGVGANISAVQQAKQILLGSQGISALTNTMVQASRFIDNLEQSLPQTDESRAVIERLRQNPELTWLFDGSNSPRSVISAIAANNTTTNSNFSQHFKDRNAHGVSDWYILQSDRGPVRYAVNAPNANQQTSQTARAQVEINPLSTQDIQRYFTDPTTGRVFANVMGEVREITSGKFTPINYRDNFTVSANSRGNLSNARVDASGNIIGTQYFFNPGSDDVYNAIANYVKDLQSNRQTFNEQTLPGQVSTIRDLMQRNLTASDREIANQLLTTRQNQLQEQLTPIQQAVTTSKSRLQSAIDQITEYKSNPNNFVMSGGQLIERVPGLFNSLTSSLNELTNQFKTAENNLRQVTTTVGIQDILPELRTRLGSERQLAENYDQFGNALFNGRNVNDYRTVLEALDKEIEFDRLHGTTRNSSAYIDLDRATATAGGTFKDLIWTPFYENIPGYYTTNTFTGSGTQDFINQNKNTSVRGIVPIGYNLTSSLTGRDISGPLYESVRLAAEGIGGTRQIPQLGGTERLGGTLRNPITNTNPQSNHLLNTYAVLDAFGRRVGRNIRPHEITPSGTPIRHRPFGTY